MPLPGGSMSMAAGPASLVSSHASRAAPRGPQRQALLQRPPLPATLTPHRPRELARLVARAGATAPLDPSAPGTSGRPAEEGQEAPEAWQCSWPCSFEADYALGAFIAKGSFGRVYHATCLRTGARVAVKVLAKRREGMAAARYQARVEKEVDVLEQLQGTSGGVLHLRGTYHDADNVYIVTELANGGDLGAFLSAHGSMTEREAARAMRSILGVIVACHERGILYGDVKPANFLLRAPYPAAGAPLEVVVADFGGAQALGGERAMRPAGTPLFLAPEVFMCCYGLPADVWSCGVLMHALLTGRVPIVPGGVAGAGQLSPVELAAAIVEGELDTGADHFVRLSPEARDLIARMLDKDEDERISAADALAHPWFAAAADAEGWALPDWAARRASVMGSVDADADADAEPGAAVPAA